MSAKNNFSKKPYIIAETAYNHEGDINYLFKMIDEISDLKLNAIKFHMLLNLSSYMHKKHPLIKQLKNWIFNEKQWDNIINYSVKKGLDVILLCDDVESVEYIIKKKKKVKAIELHAVSLNDYFLLDAISKFNGQIILGIGGSTIDEIKYALKFLKQKKKQDIILMYGFQSYPTNYAEINLSKMLNLLELFDFPIGYADHTKYNDPNNEIISIMAATMGFNILEKHFTLDFGKERIDYHAAVGKEQMMEIKNLMQIALTVHGSDKLKMSKAEIDYGIIGPMKKAIVARKNIKKGEKLSFDNLWFKRTEEESNIKQSQFLKLIGLKAMTDIKQDEIITFDKINY